MSNIFYYNPNTIILNYNCSNFSSRPIIQFNDDIKTINYYLIDNIDNIKINENNGIIIFQNNINIGIYNINICCTINEINLYTIFKLIIKPIIIYNYYSLNYNSNYEKIVPNINPYSVDSSNNILFTSENIPNNINLDTNGTITLSDNINVGLYNFMINCLYNDIKIATFVNIKINPIIYYEINNIELMYNEIKKSCIPYCYPNNNSSNNNSSNNIGKFYISKLLPNIIINNESGIITINTIDVGKYELIINYELNNIITSTNYTILIKSIFYYDESPIIEYGTTFLSVIPIVSQPGGIFYSENNNITINENGQISILNFDIGNYSIEIFYNKNNSIVSTIYNIIVIPNVYYEKSESEIIYGSSHTSSQPIINSNLKGVFTILNIIDNINIDSDSGIIHFGFIIDIGEYNLLIKYIINEYCYKIINYKLIIKPVFNIYNSIQNINYGNKLDNINFLILPNNGSIIYKLKKNNIIVNDDIYINNTNINLSCKDIGNYLLELTYTINNISSLRIYLFNILPYIKYKNNFLSINYNTSENSELPLIIPNIDGIFYSDDLPNNCFIDNSGIIIFTDKMIVQNTLFKIYFKYKEQELEKILITDFLININPVIYYPNNNNIDIIYDPDNLIILSPKPNIIYNDNYKSNINFETNNEYNITIDSNGILSIPSNLNINKYNIEIIVYFENNLQNSIIYTINIKSKELLVNFIINDKYYDGLTICNLISNSNLNYDAFYEDPNVGNNKKIYITNIISDNLNYYISDKICYGNILPKLIDISFNGINKIYDGNINAFVTHNSFLDLTYNAYFENCNCGIQKIIINKINTNNINYITNEEYITYAEIIKININVIIEAYDKEYDGTLNANTKIIKLENINDIINNIDDINLLYDSYYINSNVENNKEIIINNIRINDNYNVTFNTISSNIIQSSIIPKNIYPDIQCKDKIYDGTNITNIILNTNIEGLYINSFDSYYLDTNVGTQDIYINNIILEGTYKNNYIINNIKTNGIILQKNITIEVIPQNKYFDNNNNIYGNINILDKILNDDINIINYNIIVNDYNVANDKEINLINYELSGLSKNNYVVNQIIKNKVNILPVEIKVKFEAIDKIYDNELKAFIKVVSINENITITSYNAEYESVTVAKNKKINITNIKFKINNLDNNNYYILDTYIYGNITPKPLNIIITGIDKIYDGTMNADIIINNINGLFHEDNIFIQSYKANFINSLVENNKTIIVSDIIVSGKSYYNYYVPNLNCKGNILKKELIVNFTSIDKIYNGLLDTTVNYNFLNLFINDNIYINSYSANYLDPNIGKNKIIEIKNIIVDNNNYFISDICCLGNIIPQEIDIIFIGNNKIYDENTNIDITYEPLPINITFESYFEDPNYGNNKKIIISNIKIDSTELSTNYKIKNNNYITYGNIYKIEYIPKLKALDKEFDGTTTVIIENLDNNINLIYEAYFISENVNNNIQIIVKNIKYTDNYFINDLILYANIYPKMINYNFNFDDKIYDNTNIAISKIDTNITNIISYIAIYDNKNCGENNINVTNIILKSKNYCCSDLICKGKIIPKILNINFESKSKIYDGNTIINLKENNNDKYFDNDVYVESINANFINEYVGNNKKIIINNITLGGSDKNNYIVNDYILYNDIKPKQLNIIVDILDKEYDGTSNIIINNIKLDGIINNENVYIKSYNAYYDNSIAGNNKIIYINNIVLQGIKKDNYYINDLITSGNILPKIINAKFIAYDKKYDGNNLAIIHGTLCDIINNDQVYLSNYNAQYEDENIGNNKNIFINNIILSGINSCNYQVNNSIIIGNII
jgi:hypothetical protein